MNTPPPSAPIRVLHAEDDEQVAMVVSLMFARTQKDCVVEHVATGRECLEMMRRNSYDVVLVDLVLPDTDGLHILGELTARRDPTPVIVVSGQGQNKMVVRALRAGAVDCIDKNSPDFRRVPEITRRVADRHRKRREVAAPPRDHRIVLIEPDPLTGATISEFLGRGATRIAVTLGNADEFGEQLRSEQAFDAVILGPGLEDSEMLDSLRQLHSTSPDTPAVVLSTSDVAETAIAAFQLGAHDLLVYQDGCLPDLVFSLNNALKRADTEKLNRRLAAELADLNRSLADQVAERTRDLQAEITVRKAAEKRAEENAARLQALSNRLLHVQEEERRAIARELHDQVGQLLTGLRFRLEAVRKDPAAVVDALNVTDDLLRTVREMTLQLRPRMLDDLGLKPALEWHVGRFHEQTAVAVELDLALPAERLPAVLETTVYRIVQEALTNIARHSGAKEAVVTVAADDAALHVEVSDRGRGFDTADALARRNSVGLAGIAERVHLAGGTLELFSQSGHGTRIHAEFPLKAIKPQES